MYQASLSFDQHDFRDADSQNQLFSRAADEVRHDAIERQPVPFDHDSGLPRGDEFRVVAAFFQAIGDLDRDDHLADRAIVADGVNAETIGT